MTMIERVARAIVGPHLPVPEGSHYTLEELREFRWREHSTAADRQQAINAARAVIDEMRKPTDAQLSATEDVATGYDDFACGDGTLYLSYPGFYDYAKTTWQTMIDAALSEQQP